VTSPLASKPIRPSTGPGLEHTLMVAAADTRKNPKAAEVVARFRAQGYEPPGFTLYAYAAIQVWAQAAEAAGSLDLGSVVKTMHNRQFDTVIGKSSVAIALLATSRRG
jgi:branched-chain amino acid transport system substrate-binding protein